MGARASFARRSLPAAWLAIALAAGACQPAEEPVEEPADAAEPAVPEAPVATIFAPGVVSTEAPEFATSFAPGGSRVFFNRASPDRSLITMISAELLGESWQELGELPFAGEHGDVDPFVTADGSRLYFSSNRPAADGALKEDFDIWYSERQGEGWGAPVSVGAPVNTPATEVFASLSEAGTVYFGSDRDGFFDIYRAAAAGDGFQEPQRLGLASDDETSVGNPWIAADESFLVISSGRPGGLGGSDLWISFARGDRWTPPTNLGPLVNSPQADFAPALSPDGRYLYFTSERPGIVPADSVDGRPPGDIYRIPLGPLLWSLGANRPRAF